MNIQNFNTGRYKNKNISKSKTVSCTPTYIPTLYVCGELKLSVLTYQYSTAEITPGKQKDSFTLHSLYNKGKYSKSWKNENINFRVSYKASTVWCGCYISDKLRSLITCVWLHMK